jgi:predicted O-methyltransferase YrrM
MTEKTWSAVDRYIAEQLIPHDGALQAALEASAAAGLPDIQVSACQGKLLQMLVRIHGARRILELGTLGGYSTIWLAGGLPPGGRLITLEYEAKHAAVARTNLACAGFAESVEVRVGPALAILPQLAEEKQEPFDLIFIDADKENYPEYFAWALRLSRRGTVIIADNVVRNGAVTDPECDDPRVQAVRLFYELVAAEPRVTATAIQTVGTKGYDGFAIAIVIAD